MAQCQNCSIPLLRKDSSNIKTKTVSFFSKIPNQQVRVVDALQIVFPLSHVADDEEFEANAGRKLCYQCAKALGNFYKYYQEFQIRTNKKSYVMKNCFQAELSPSTSTSNKPFSSCADVEVQTNWTQEKLVKALTKTPIREKMLKAATSREYAFYKTIRTMVYQEITRLSNDPMFNRKPTPEHLLPSSNDVRIKLESEGPMLLAILQGLCLKEKKKQSLVPAMTSVLGISVYSHNQKCNLFQKSIGLALWRTSASVQTYDLFRGLGISTSYITINRTLDDLKLDYDKPGLKLEKETEDVMNQAIRPVDRPIAVARRKLDLNNQVPVPTTQLTQCGCWVDPIG